MDNLLAQLDQLLRPVNEAVRRIDPSKLVQYIAIYTLVAGIFSICGGIALFSAGALAGIGGIVGGVGLEASGAVDAATQRELAEANRALSELGAVSGFAIFWGILSLIAAPFLIIAAIGLFQRKNWGRMTAVLAFAVNAIVSLLGIISGGSGFLSIIWVLLSAYLAYFLYRDEGVRAQFT
jgi:hypothetical protein